jgi:hypothetical protein
MTFEQRAKYMPGVAPRYSSRQQRQFGRGLIRIYLLEGDKILAPSLAKAAVPAHYMLGLYWKRNKIMKSWTFFFKQCRFMPHACARFDSVSGHILYSIVGPTLLARSGHPRYGR